MMLEPPAWAACPVTVRTAAEPALTAVFMAVFMMNPPPR